MQLALTEAERERIITKLAKPSGLVQGVCEIAGEPVVLDRWQASQCDAQHNFWIMNKSRQIGWSFGVPSCRAWSRCYLSAANTYKAVFVSYNLDDCLEKIRYVDGLDMSLPANERMRRLVDTKKEIEFENGNRIISAFKPRGKSKAEVFIDELAHMAEARDIYRSCMPILTRGGSIFIGSTPMAEAGMFHSIWSGEGGKFKKFKHLEIPWWKSKATCVSVKKAALAGVAEMATAERVERFATEELQDIFDGMFEEDFQTEYECKWSDESKAFLPWTLIERCSPAGEAAIERVFNIEGFLGRKSALYAGMDVGRKIDESKIVIGERTRKGGPIEDRLRITLRKMPFPEQQAVTNKIFSLPNLRRFVIDYTGLGIGIGDYAAKDWGSKAMLQVMSRTSKPLLASNLRMFMEKGNYLFYPDRDVRQQMHSVKKIVSGYGNIAYDVDKNEKHHADEFWASALMLWGAREDAEGSGISIHIAEFENEEDIGPREVKFVDFGKGSFGL